MLLTIVYSSFPVSSLISSTHNPTEMPPAKVTRSLHIVKYNGQFSDFVWLDVWEALSEDQSIRIYFLHFFLGLHTLLFLPSTLLIVCSSFLLLNPALFQTSSCWGAPGLSPWLCPLFILTLLLISFRLMVSLSTCWWLPQAYFQIFVMTNAYLTSLLGWLIKIFKSTCPRRNSWSLPRNLLPLSLSCLSW